MIPKVYHFREANMEDDGWNVRFYVEKRRKLEERLWLDCDITKEALECMDHLEEVLQMVDEKFYDLDYMERDRDDAIRDKETAEEDYELARHEAKELRDKVKKLNAKLIQYRDANTQLQHELERYKLLTKPTHRVRRMKTRDQNNDRAS